VPFSMTKTSNKKANLIKGLSLVSVAKAPSFYETFLNFNSNDVSLSLPSLSSSQSLQKDIWRFSVGNSLDEVLLYCCLDGWVRISETCKISRKLCVVFCLRILQSLGQSLGYPVHLSHKKERSCFKQLRNFIVFAQGGIFMMLGGDWNELNCSDNEATVYRHELLADQVPVFTYQKSRLFFDVEIAHSYHGFGFSHISWVVYHEGEISLFYGTHGNSPEWIGIGPTGFVEKFNIFSGVWSVATYSSPLPSTNNSNTLPHLSGVSIAAYQGKYWMTGGQWPYSSYFELNNKMYCMQIEKNSLSEFCWKEMDARLIHCRYDHASVEFKGNLWVVGGCGEKTVEIYDTNAGAFIEGPSLCGHQPEGMLGLLVIFDELYVAYVEGLNMSTTVEKFNSTTNSWEILTNYPSRIYGTALSIGGKIYFVELISSRSGNGHIFDVVSGEWISDVSLPGFPKANFLGGLAIVIPEVLGCKRWTTFLRPENTNGPALTDLNFYKG